MEALLAVPVTWEQVVLVGLFFLFQYLSNRGTKKKVNSLDNSLHNNNGGSTVKDALDRIEGRQEEQGESLNALGERMEAVEASHAEEPKSFFSRLTK